MIKDKENAPKSFNLGDNSKAEEIDLPVVKRQKIDSKEDDKKLLFEETPKLLIESETVTEN